MAYQIKKSSRITEDLELLGDNGSVELKISIDINPDNIAANYRKAQLALAHTYNAVKEKNTDETLSSYGKAIVEFVALIFGTENTEKLVEYFDGRHIEMITKLTPFIADIITPAINKSVIDTKSLIAANKGFTRKQKRRLGLK